MRNGPSRAGTLVLLTAIAVASAACGKKVPADVRATLDAARADAEKVATTAATVCAAQYASGRFSVKGGGCSTNLLPGETIVPSVPSPAKGTPLASNPSVVEVKVNCVAPTTPPGANPSSSCGIGLGSLHDVSEVPVKDRGPVERCANEADCEQAFVPSAYATGTETVDLRVTKPVSGGPPGAYSEVIVALTKK